jgi:hypothetical protein
MRHGESWYAPDWCENPGNAACPGKFSTGRMEPKVPLPGLGTFRRVGANKPSGSTERLRSGCWSKVAIVARYLLCPDGDTLCWRGSFGVVAEQ